MDFFIDSAMGIRHPSGSFIFSSAHSECHRSCYFIVSVYCTVRRKRGIEVTGKFAGRFRQDRVRTRKASAVAPVDDGRLEGDVRDELEQ